jgi:Zn-dependent metalloprotease
MLGGFVRKNVYPLFGLLIFATVSTSYLVLNSQKEAGLGAVEQIEVSDLIANSPQTALAKPRQNPREIPDIDPVSDNLSDDERDAQARQFAELFRPSEDLREVSSVEAPLDEIKRNDIARLKGAYGNDLRLEIRQGSSRQIRGITTSISLENFSADDTSTLDAAVSDLVVDYGGLFGVRSADDIAQSSSFCSGDICTTKVKKTFNGLPAWDHELAVTTQSGRVFSVQGEFYEPRLGSYDDPNMQQPEMVTAIATAFGVSEELISIDGPSELGIARDGGVDFVAYKLPSVFVADAPYEIVINANSGIVASRETLIQHAATSATGTDLTGATVTFEANESGSFYEMTDTRFPTGHKTEVVDFGGLPWSAKQGSDSIVGNGVITNPVTSSNLDSGWDAAAVSAISNAKKVSDYYKNTHSYSVIQNQGSAITIGVNGKAGNAAYYNSTSVMEFGVGLGNMAEEGLSFAVALDVMGHEMTHGVISSTSPLRYRGQSGALNESFSDFMGAMVDSGDWLIGEELRAPDGQPTRSLMNPANASTLTWPGQHWSGSQPSHMSDYRVISYDSGGVHIYSGIINRALYLLAEGLSVENLGTSIGKDKTASLVFKTMTGLSNRAQFDDAVAFMAALAEAEYPDDAAVKQAVLDAFLAVGLPTTATQTSTGTATGLPASASAMMFLKPYFNQATTKDIDNKYDVYIQVLDDTDPKYASELQVGPLNPTYWANDTRPTFVRREDGSFFLLYKTKLGDTYLYSSEADSESKVDLDLTISDLTISQDGNILVFSIENENKIYTYNIVNDDFQSNEISLPSYTQGGGSLPVVYVDTLRFDPTSRSVIFDFALCSISSGAACSQRYWSVGVLNVATLELEFPFPSQPARYDIGFPAFSNLTDRYIVVDIINNEAETDSGVSSGIYIYDRNDKSLVGLANTDGTTSALGHWATPSFSSDDSHITFSRAIDSGTGLLSVFLEDYDLTSAEEKYRSINPNFADKPFAVPAVAVNKVPSLTLPTPSLAFGDVTKGSSPIVTLCIENNGDFPINVRGLSGAVTNINWVGSDSAVAEKTKACSDLTLTSAVAAIGEFENSVSILHDGANSPTPLTLTGHVDLDTDSDGVLNYKDTDDDGDSVLDANDAFPLDSTETIDTDADGVGNNADTDDDGDNALDVNDAYPLISVGELADTDKDGRPNDCDEACVTKGMTADADDDGDSVLDTSDAFPLDATESVDTDSDGVGNNADADDDGDSMDDAFEIANSLNPLVNDADGDSDGDGLTNFQEFTDGTPLDKDSLAPVLTMPDNVTFDSTGPLTVVVLGASSAEDFLDGAVTVALSRTNPFVPGLHEVTYTASDAAGNKTSAVQTLILKPMLDVPKAGQTVEGKDYTVVAFLNGQAAAYPVLVPVTFSGTATQDEDYTASAEFIQIDSGTSGSLVLSITDDGQSEEDESILVTLGAPESNAVLGSVIEQEVSIVSTAVPPKLRLAVQQNGLGGSFIATDSGNVLVSLSIADVNGTHTVDWTSSDNNVVALDSSTSLQLEFDPVSMAAGVYKVLAQVTDSEIADKTFPASIIVKVNATSAPLDTDGDGIPDEQDTFDASNAIALENGTGAVHTDSGLTLVLGDSALNKGNAGIAVTEADVASSGEGTGPSSFGSDSSYNYPGGLYDFKVNGLPVAGGSVNVVIPLSPAAPANAQYRKYTDLSGWKSFVSDTSNAVKTAAGASGACPQAGSASYQSGLTQGHTCLQLTIEDGGPNDADGSANGVVDDPGGIGIVPQAITPAAPVPAQSSGGGGGGGGCSVGTGTRDPMLPLIVLLCIVGLTRHKWRVLLRKQVG